MSDLDQLTALQDELSDNGSDKESACNRVASVVSYSQIDRR